MKAFDREVTPAPPPQADARHGNGNRFRPSRNGNGVHLTDSQRRAIEAIARRINTDPAYEAREIAGAELDDLSVRLASDLIDHLKGLEAASNGRR